MRNSRRLNAWLPVTAIAPSLFLGLALIASPSLAQYDSDPTRGAEVDALMAACAVEVDRDLAPFVADNQALGQEGLLRRTAYSILQETREKLISLEAYRGNNQPSFDDVVQCFRKTRLAALGGAPSSSPRPSSDNTRASQAPPAPARPAQASSASTTQSSWDRHAAERAERIREKIELAKEEREKAEAEEALSQQDERDKEETRRVAEIAEAEEREAERKRHKPELEASYCLTPLPFGQGLYGGFSNSCSFKVNVAFCNYHPAKDSWAASFNCEKSGGVGLSSVDANGRNTLHTNDTEETAWAACQDPSLPMDTEFVVGEGLRHRCR
jgi:hypothetical protein